MVEWICHPAEFGKPPKSIQIVDMAYLEIDTDQMEHCYLLKYIMDDGSVWIGFNGPTVWTFFIKDLSKTTYHDLFLKYVGWYLTGPGNDGYEYDKTHFNCDEKEIHKYLVKHKYSGIETLQSVYMGDRNFYEFEVTHKGERIIAVGYKGGLKTYAKDFVLPFFHFIGEAFNPFRTN